MKKRPAFLSLFLAGFALFGALLLSLSLPGLAVVTASPDDEADEEEATEVTPSTAEDPQQSVRALMIMKKIAALKPQTGTVILQDGLATLDLPEGLCYLNPRDARTVIVDLWGNPPESGKDTLGMILQKGENAVEADGWGIVISFNDDGYVDDADAAKIDYADVLKNMQEATVEENEERVKEGFGKIQLVGWAEPPHYDSAAHKIYWAKELAFEGSEESTLNYCVRILGRRGVLELNAVAGISELPVIREQTQALLPKVDFNAGHRYADYNAATDKLATYGIAALVAGGVASKMGLFKVLLAALLAAKKLVIVAVIALAAGLKKFFVGKPKEAAVKEEDTPEQNPRE